MRSWLLLVGAALPLVAAGIIAFIPASTLVASLPWKVIRPATGAVSSTASSGQSQPQSTGLGSSVQSSSASAPPANTPSVASAPQTNPTAPAAQEPRRPRFPLLEFVQERDWKDGNGNPFDGLLASCNGDDVIVLNLGDYSLHKFERSQLAPPKATLAAVLADEIEYLTAPVDLKGKDADEYKYGTEKAFPNGFDVKTLMVRTSSKTAGFVDARAYNTAPNGKLYRTARTMDGVGDGVTVKYYPSGRVFAITFLEDWKPLLVFNYYENGILMSFMSFTDGKAHGSASKYYPNGNLLGVSTMTNGVPHGESRFFTPNGRLAITGESRNGNVVRSENLFRDAKLEDQITAAIKAASPETFYQIWIDELRNNP